LNETFTTFENGDTYGSIRSYGLAGFCLTMYVRKSLVTMNRVVLE